MAETGLPKRIHPVPVVADEAPAALDLLERHPLDDFLKADFGVGIAADARERVPKVRPDNVGSRHSAPDLVVPSHAGLGPRVGLHGRSEIPLERPLVVAGNSQPHRVHDADQLLGVGVSGTRGGLELCHRLGEAPGLHEVPGLLDVSSGRSRESGRRGGEERGREVPNCGHAPARARRARCGARAAAICIALAQFAIGGKLPAALAEEAPALPEPVVSSDFDEFDEAKAALGQLLFYDPILSGNRNISCGTCHHHTLSGADELSLGFGEGGAGIGAERHAPEGVGSIKRRMPRNSPALFNLGAREFRTLFHDGRVSIDDLYGTEFNTPAEEYLPQGLDSLLAAQALFPLVGEIEMAGAPEENEVSASLTERIDYGWPLIVERVRGIPEYRRLFAEAFAGIETAGDIRIEHVGNAVGEFVGSEWRSHDSPFDRYLEGDRNALSPRQIAGMDLFYGRAGCSACHGGKFLTDHSFHALAIPPIGPGRTRRFDLHARDLGRMAESDRLEDAYRFRTPSLRNVALTAPYGHNGAYRDLEGIIRHHLAPLESLENWVREQAVLPAADWLEAVDYVVLDDRLEMARYRRHLDIEPVSLSDDEIAALVAFMHALTGQDSTKGQLGRPDEVPSGLPVD